MVSVTIQALPATVLMHDRNDIDYMNGYRDFDNDKIRYSYDDAKAFLDKLHKSGRHYVPIVDAALYIPNPNNASDA